MPRTIRFPLDENCAKAISGGLTRLGIDVTTTPKMGLMGATDEQQAAHCLAERRVLFTQDQDFLRLDAAGVEHAGIAFCAKDARSIGEIIQPSGSAVAPKAGRIGWRNSVTVGCRVVSLQRPAPNCGRLPSALACGGR